MLLNEVINKLVSVTQVILVILLVSLVSNVTWQVVTRFVLPQPSSFTEELARFLLIWISLLGSTIAYRNGAHLGFDLISSNIAAQKRALMMRSVNLIVCLVSFLVLIVGGTNLVLLTQSLGQYSSVIGLPMALVYAVVPISGLLLCVFSIEKAVIGGDLNTAQGTQK